MMSDRLAGFAAGLMAGLELGYSARCREESESWREESAPRVFVGGQFWERPTAAELRHRREVILREAHKAGLHDHRPRACPMCCASKPEHKHVWQAGRCVAGDCPIRHHPYCAGIGHPAASCPTTP